MRIYFLFILSLIVAPCFGQVAAFEDGNTSIKKGNLLISTTFSVNHREGENESLLVQNFDETYFLDWDVTLRSGYFIKDNFAIGGFVNYSNKLNRLFYQGDNGQTSEKVLEREYSIAPFIRNYIALGNGRFCLFNETSLQFTYGSSVRQIEDELELNRTVGESFGLRLGIQPGIAAFITENIAFEVGTSLLGLSTTYSTEVLNGNEDDEGYAFSNEVDFKVDLLNLFLGITFYFPTK